MVRGVPAGTEFAVYRVYPPFSGGHTDVYGGCVYHRLANGFADLVEPTRTVNRSRRYI
jgi:hypothetical protein